LFLKNCHAIFQKQPKITLRQPRRFFRGGKLVFAELKQPIYSPLKESRIKNHPLALAYIHWKIAEA
jgi:hypothetical protein